MCMFQVLYIIYICYILYIPVIYDINYYQSQYPKLLLIISIYEYIV